MENMLGLTGVCFMHMFIIFGISFGVLLGVWFISLFIAKTIEIIYSIAGIPLLQEIPMWKVSDDVEKVIEKILNSYKEGNPMGFVFMLIVMLIVTIQYIKGFPF